MIGVIECGIGNIRSVANALDLIGVEWKTISSGDDNFQDVTHLILPGVGAFSHGMNQLKSRGLIDPIKNHVTLGKPLLGICLGMQLLFESSEENGHFEGLGIIKGRVLALSSKVKDVRVPHVGWNTCKLKKESHYKIQNTYYFTHSYFCQCDEKKNVLATTDYEIVFESVVESGAVLGVQFHPEKSHSAGIALLKQFTEVKC